MLCCTFSILDSTLLNMQIGVTLLLLTLLVSHAWLFTASNCVINVAMLPLVDNSEHEGFLVVVGVLQKDLRRYKLVNDVYYLIFAVENVP